MRTRREMLPEYEVEAFGILSPRDKQYLIPIRDYIKDRCFSLANQQLGKDIAGHFGIPYKTFTACVMHLKRSDNLIGSNDDGFWWIADLREWEIADRFQYKKWVGIYETRQGLARARRLLELHGPHQAPVIQERMAI